MTKRTSTQLAVERPALKVGIDMRLTTEHLALLTPEQTQAVFEGVGRLAALGLTR